MKILLAVDGSEYTNRMLSYLIAHKDWSKAGHASSRRSREMRSSASARCGIAAGGAPFTAASMRDAASSIKSMALSGKKRDVM